MCIFYGENYTSCLLQYVNLVMSYFAEIVYQLSLKYSKYYIKNFDIMNLEVVCEYNNVRNISLTRLYQYKMRNTIVCAVFLLHALACNGNLYV